MITKGQETRNNDFPNNIILLLVISFNMCLKIKDVFKLYQNNPLFYPKHKHLIIYLLVIKGCFEF